MRHSLLIAVAVGVSVLSIPSTQSPAQTPGAATAAPGLPCNGTRILDPFQGPLAGPDLPPSLLPIKDDMKVAILRSGLPCQENVTAQTLPDGKEAQGLESLQRGFDFYSWRTFLALNAPADGSPIEQASADKPTLWEDMDSFKQLLDVMLPADLQPRAQWPTDRAGMAAERERLVPAECLAQHQAAPTKMIVKMIEESFNEPFKTGPLIDQQGHYAIFDILMNRQMFKYIIDHKLDTKAGQAANADLAIDFPAGQNASQTSDKSFGSFMLKVSWKILSPSEIQAKNFHMVDALVLMPPPDDTAAKRQCLPKMLGLTGFHAVHKTVGRPQWIWTSFEHIQNVPDKDEVAANKLNGPYSFFSTDCGDRCPVANATPPHPWDPDPTLELRFRSDDSFKSQIVRETPLTNAAKNMNKIFQSMLQNSVWKNYMLLSTQWPSATAGPTPAGQPPTPGCTKLFAQNPDAPAPKTDFLKQPDMTCSPAPAFLANSTLETYSQGEVPLASSSCIACHGNSVGFQRGASNRQPGKADLNQSDFTFMLEKAQ
jgi:hypothetical protein